MGRSVASSSSKQHPSYRLLEQNAFQQEAYEQYRRRCLKERKAVGTPLPSSGMHMICGVIEALLRPTDVDRFAQALALLGYVMYSTLCI